MKTIHSIVLFLLTPFAIHCNPCSAPQEATRMLQGQANIVECGRLKLSDSTARGNEIVTCMNRAAAEQQSFRATSASSRGLTTVAFGRTIGGRYEVRMVSHDFEQSYADTSVCYGANEFIIPGPPNSGATYFSWTCPEHTRANPLPSPPAYNPPSVVPDFGRICPVM